MYKLNGQDVDNITPKKLLVVSPSNVTFGGIEIYLINAFSRIEMSFFDITFLSSGKSIAEELAKKINCVVDRSIYLGLDSYRHKSILSKCKCAYITSNNIIRLQKEERFDIVYINSVSFISLANLLVATKWCGIPRRIAHSHIAKIPGSALKELVRGFFRKIIVNNATDFLACSRPAAEHLFGKEATQKTVILKNGIDTRRFAFSASMREYCRKELGFDVPDYVIGHVGRFEEQKNHRFLIDIFSEVSKVCPEARLLLLGEGTLQEEIRQKVVQYGLEDKVIFAGVKERTERYYCAMDVFVLPSLYEGLGIVNMEAQASGLSCVVSDVVPREADVSGRMEFLPLGDATVWRDSLLKYKGLAHEREGDWRDVYDAGYDVEKTAQALTELFGKGNA